MTRFCDNIKLREELKECKAQNTLLIAGSAKCEEQLEIINNSYTEVLGNLDDANGKITLLTEGPEPPAAANLRVITTGLLHTLSADRLGARYTDLHIAGKVFWSDTNFLISQKPDLDRHCLYLREHWLPIVKPYTVIEWVRLDGDVVDIAQCDCDNFAGWWKYKDAEHGLWAALAKTLVWAVVTGPLMKGYHAFGTQPTWAEPYNEQSIKGLELWTMEPQVLRVWPVEVPGIGIAKIGQVVDIVPKPTAGLFTIGSMGLSIT